MQVHLHGAVDHQARPELIQDHEDAKALLDRLGPALGGGLTVRNA